MTLRSIAHRAAILAYREAFQRGTLGTAHAIVVDEVLHLTADELRHWGKRARKGWAIWMVASLVWLAASAITTFAFDWSWYAGPGFWPLVIALICAGNASTKFGEWSALNLAASSIDPPAQINEESPDA